ncbi:MAG: leucine-rich repeat protein [Lachnospiraceae bacterium]|nr:leucine-rich repeat protein [Lachnospiraceae bacterium]
MSRKKEVFWDWDSLRFKYGYKKKKARKKQNKPYHNSKSRVLSESNFTQANARGHEYEYYCADYLKERGFTNVHVTNASGDNGVDIIAVKGGIRYAVQCKYWKSNVGNHAVQEVFSGMTYYGCSRAIVITNSNYTSAAINMAKRLNVELWSNVDFQYDYDINTSPFKSIRGNKKAWIIIIISICITIGSEAWNYFRSKSANQESSYIEVVEVEPETITINDLNYSIHENYVSLINLGKNIARAEVPESVQGLPVKEIANNAFKDSEITEVSLPDSIEKIGEYAFANCINLTSITIPSNVRKIENNCFYNCKNLSTITFRGEIESIGNNAFQFCAFEKITMPDGLKTIGGEAFLGCEKLQYIVLEDGLYALGDGAFRCCSSLRKIDLPDSLTTIGRKCFYECRSIKEITIPENVTSLDTYAFVYCEKLKKVYIPSSCDIPQGRYPFVCTDPELEIIRY